MQSLKNDSFAICVTPTQDECPTPIATSCETPSNMVSSIANIDLSSASSQVASSAASSASSRVSSSVSSSASSHVARYPCIDCSRDDCAICVYNRQRMYYRNSTIDSAGDIDLNSTNFKIFLSCLMVVAVGTIVVIIWIANH